MEFEIQNNKNVILGKLISFSSKEIIQKEVQRVRHRKHKRNITTHRG